MKNLLYVLPFVLLFVTCKKEHPVKEATQQTYNDVADTVDYYGFDESLVWTFEKLTLDDPPYPYEPTFYHDTIIYFYDGDTVMTRDVVIEPGIVESYGTHTYKKIKAIKKTRTYSDFYAIPDYPTGTYEYEWTALYVYDDKVEEKLYAAKGYSTGNIAAEDQLLYDYKLRTSDSLPFSMWTSWHDELRVSQTFPMNMGGGLVLRGFDVVDKDGEAFGTYIDGIGGLNGLIEFDDFTSGIFTGMISVKSDHFTYVP